MKKLMLFVICLMAFTAFEKNANAATTIGNPLTVSQADTTQHAEYVGKYKMEGMPFDYVELTTKDGKLHYVAGEYQGDLTSKTAKDEFDANGQATIKFTRDASNMVKGISLNAQGQDFTGIKEKPKVDMASYLGKYKMDGLPFDYIELTDKAGKLHYMAGDNEGDLTPMKDKDQFDANGQAMVKFTRDDANLVKSINVNIQGQDYIGNREATANSMAAYAGQYKMTGLPFETMEIKAVDGKLLINAMGEEGELTPLAAPDQFDAAGRATLKFIRNAGGQVTGVTLDAQGQNFEGVKK